MGESGTAITRWCVSQGSKVTIADTRQKTQLSENALQFEKAARDLGITDIHFGQFSSDLLNDIDIVAISPGLSPIAEPIESFIKEVDLDALYRRNIPAIEARAVAPTLMRVLELIDYYIFIYL